MGRPFQAVCPITPRVYSGGYISISPSEVPNDEQQFTATCVEPLDGEPVTATIPAGFLFRLTKEQANADALALATEQAEAQLVCS